MIKTMIPTGALCCQDFSVFRWPRKTDDPYTIFDGVKNSEGGVRLKAPGYGQMGNYGCGYIYLIIPLNLGTMPILDLALQSKDPPYV
jgi:hypothetical protein